MKTQRYIKQLLCIAAWLPMAHLAAAQADTIPASGTWKKLTVTASDTVYLTGDTIHAKGTIQIGDDTHKGNVDVTLINKTGHNITVLDEVEKDDGSHGGQIFNVYSGNSLTIKGENENDSVIFDGGAGFRWVPSKENVESFEFEGDGKNASEYKHRYELTKGNEEKLSSSSMFATNGDLTLEYVKIHDYYTTNAERSPIRIGALAHDEDVVKCGKTTLRHCTIENCQAPMGSAIHEGNDSDEFNLKETDPKKCAVTLDHTTIRHCISTIKRNDKDNNKYDGWGGGAIRTGGKSTCDLTLTNCDLTENYSQGDGSSVFWNAGGSGEEGKIPQLTIEGCTFDGNGAKRDGGAVIAETEMKFEGTNNKFTHNFCGRQGGAILVRPKVSGKEGFEVTESTYEFKNVDISQNNAGERGGGIAIDFPKDSLIKDGYRFEVDLEVGTNIHNNTAGKHGGGISFTNEIKDSEKNLTFQLNLDGGMIKGNTATDSLGGGIYVNHSNISHSEKTSGIEISENSAKVGGGGIYLTEGTMDISTVKIQKNETEGFGGGVYISNTNAQQRDSLILRSGGTISENKSTDAGGGIAIAGYADVTVDGVNIQKNTSKHNGGGLYLKGDSAHNKRAEMIIESGIISSNIAEEEKLSEDTGDTGYSKSESEIEGFGGGVYLDCFSYLKFNLDDNSGKKQIGLYGNKAANGADDIFSVNDSSTVDLPNVKSMQLEGLGDETKDSLFWAEDYPTKDPHYKDGTHEGTEEENTRYRDKKAIVHEVDFAGKDTVFTDDTYICLTLGRHTMIDMIIEKTGLEDRDNAIFSIFKGDDKSKDLFMNVILTKDDISSGTRRKTISVRDGMWTVKETSWSWAYDTTPPEEPTRTLNSQSTLEERTFKFENKPKENIPKHAESVKTNTMPGN